MKDRLVEFIVRHSVNPNLQGRWAVQVSPDGQEVGICWIPNPDAEGIREEGEKSAEDDAQDQYDDWMFFPLPVLSKEDMEEGGQFSEDAAWFSAELALDEWIWEVQAKGPLPPGLYGV
ncbi:MAG: hypothetical protein HW403_1065 [Dehalococcoidia bacterium]|nr:hypothetical protein [Dehalococcoidia bacterium]